MFYGFRLTVCPAVNSSPCLKLLRPLQHLLLQHRPELLYSVLLLLPPYPQKLKMFIPSFTESFP